MSTKRKICWPDPDATCLEGGCLYCNDNPYRAISTIERYASKNAELAKAFRYGERNNWGNAQSK